MVAFNQRARYLLALLIVMALLPALATNVLAHPVASSGLCRSGVSDGSRWYGMVRSWDVDNADATAVSAGWEEQDYILWDSQTGFFTSAMWLRFKTYTRVNGFPEQHWTEVGFTRAFYGPYQGNSFYMATRISTGYFESKINRNPGGAHTWHVFKMERSSTGYWYHIIDNTNYGGWTGPAGNQVDYVDIGLETTSNCSTGHITYFGSPYTSSPYAFKYKTSSGFWTTWGFYMVGQNDPPMHAQQLTYAIEFRAWQDGR